MKTKYVISICIFVILISMTCISASENVNQTDSLGLSIEDNVETAENDIGITSQIYGEVELKENENKSMNSDILGVSNEDEILGAKDIYVTGNTFKDIQNAIKNAGKGDIIHLNGTYKNNNHGNIEISKDISIIGTDNATLDAEEYSRIFYVSKTSTSIKINIQNITFINGKAYDGNPNGGNPRKVVLFILIIIFQILLLMLLSLTIPQKNVVGRTFSSMRFQI